MEDLDCPLFDASRKRNRYVQKMEKDIGEISAKMLSKELKTLEMNQLIQREVMNTKPITVQYSIIEYGKKTKDVIRAMVNWGEMHRMHLFQSED